MNTPNTHIHERSFCYELSAVRMCVKTLIHYTIDIWLHKYVVGINFSHLSILISLYGFMKSIGSGTKEMNEQMNEWMNERMNEWMTESIHFL